MLLNLHGELAEQPASSDRAGECAGRGRGEPNHSLSKQQGNISQHRGEKKPQSLPVLIVPAGG